VKPDPARRQRLKKAIAIFREHDKNRDGKLTAGEWSEFEKLDSGDDDAISLDELTRWLKEQSRE
jgi:Ca2+-binding EF-hand superfamily protein